jgi:glutathione synthase
VDYERCIYGEAIPAYLNALPESQWRSYILMRLIEPPCLKNITLRHGEPATESVINELGVYGACIWRGNRQANSLDIMYNESAGWLVRTKNRAHAEGGVGAGFGSLDSLFLVDEWGLGLCTVHPISDTIRIKETHM